MVSYFSWLRRSFLRGMIRTIAWKLRGQGISFLRSTSISMILLNHNNKSFVPGLEKVRALPTMARLLVVSYRLFVVVNGHEGSSQNIGNTFLFMRNFESFRG